MTTRKRKVFVSFDFDHDRILREFIIGQTRLPDSPFVVEDWSLKEAAPQATWENQAREKIKRSDTVLVMLGAHTHRAPGVRKEVKMARELGKQIFQVIGYRDSHPTPVTDAGQVYRWDWSNLKTLLSPVPLSNNTLRTRNPFRPRRLS